MPNPNSARLAARQKSVIAFLVDRFPTFPEDVKSRFPSLRSYEAETETWRQRLQLKLGELGPEQVEEIVEEGDDFLKRAGGTMLGFLTLFTNPTDPLHATTKQYVDAALQALKVFLLGEMPDVPPLLTQHKHVEITPANPWVIHHGRSVRPGRAQVMSTPDYREVLMFRSDDSILGWTTLTFGYNLAGEAILTFT